MRLAPPRKDMDKKELRLLQLEKLRPEWFKEAIATESVDGI